MATLAEIYDWFMTGKKPTQAHFWASWGSFWNKGESIPQSSISGLPGVLNAKAEKAQFDAHKTDENAHAAILVEPNARITALESKTDSSNNFKFIPNPGYTFDPVTRVLTMAAGWIGTINDEDYTNAATQEFPAIALSNAGYSRIELIVFKEDSTFEKLVGAQSTTTPVAPVQPANTLEAMFLTVGDGVVNVPVTPKPKAPVTSVNGMRGDVVIEIAVATDTVAGMVKTDVTKPDPVVYTVETADNLLKAKVNAILEIKPITGITYTLTAYDTENLVQLAYDGTLPMTVTIPNDATLNLPVGSIFYTVGSNTGALTIAGGSGVTFQTAVGLTAGQNETRKYVKKAANTWQVEGGAQPMPVGGAKSYKTYFVNTVTGNNTTGVFEDASKPYASIDYVLALPTLSSGSTIYLQNDGGVFPINGTMPEKNLIFYSPLTVVLDFSGNANANVFANTAVSFIYYFNLPLGTLKNDRSGGTGCYFFNNAGNFTLKIDAKSIYTNTSNGMMQNPYYAINVDVMTIRSVFINNVFGSANGSRVTVNNVVCLANSASIGIEGAFGNYKINTVSGAGSYRFRDKNEIGNISTTGISDCVAGARIYFKDSVITGGGFKFCNDGYGDNYISGNVISATLFDQGGITQYGVIKFVNFSGDFGTGNMKPYNGTYIVENSSIKSTNALFAFNNAGNGTVTLKNSSFEVVNAVPLCTCNAGETRTIKIAGISTNATMISQQIGTGVTVTQFTNY